MKQLYMVQCFWSSLGVIKRLLFISIALAVHLSCKQTEERFISPPGYNINQPFIVKLPPMLDEISGLAYYSMDKSVFAIVDEKGILFKIFPADKPIIEKWKFHNKGDYEDLVLIDSTFYALMSGGEIVKFKFITKDSVTSTEFDPGLVEHNEFEILYYDKNKQQLIQICKDCEDDKKLFTTSYAFDLSTEKFMLTPFHIATNPIAQALKEEKIKYRPSAAAIHPLTGELYIISSVNKCLVVANTDGKIKKVYPLNPKLFKQPEGLAFTPNGDMLISNEAADIGAANILIYKYKRQYK